MTPADLPGVGPLVWVVGGRGLLGKAVVAAAVRRGLTVDRTQTPWNEPAAAIEALARHAAEILSSGREARLLWCAGAGVVGSGPDDLREELDVFGGFLDRLAMLQQRHPGRLSMFLASSAGGLYAGSAEAPFTEHTVPRPLAQYGETKLAMEGLARDFAARAGVPLLIGRIANLYGPGQDLSKPQGLVSQLCRSHLERRPLLIYVPLDTARDYLFVRDAAEMILSGIERTAALPAGAVTVKILASGTATTLASIIGELRRITKHRPPIILGASPASRYQSTDLRFRSVVWTDLDRLARTPLGAGMLATLEDVGNELRRPIARLS